MNFSHASLSELQQASKQALWEWQLAHNPIVRRYCDLLENDSPTFLPISFFKHFEMKTGATWEAEAIFESSGTTGMQPSKHYVKSLALYKESIIEGFHHFYPKQEYAIFALLPSYLERGNSSLVQMVKTWMDTFGLVGSGFYLYNFQALRQALAQAMDAREPILLIGVSFALLDFAQQYPIALPPDSIVMETGGMKGKRAEMIRSELHTALQKGLGVPHIHSEYGMTELLSQAYSLGNGRFQTPPWMEIHISDLHLPHIPQRNGRAGRINIIDRANVHSCAFISTDDLGCMYEDGSFEILGRIDNTEMRGCNLLYHA